MARVFVILAMILLTIYSVVEVAQTDKYAARLAPKWLWAVFVICVPVVGPVAWLFFGRPAGGRPRPASPPTMPDDDPEFLRKLNP